MPVRTLFEDLIRGLSGPLGVRLRRSYYSRRLRSCGARLVVEPGVHLLRPEWISLGDDVWIDRYAILIAGPPSDAAHVVGAGPGADGIRLGEIRIGDRAHVGVGTIIQGHGGVWIGNAFTSGAHSKIYSWSNDYRTSRAGTHPAAGLQARYVMTPVNIGDNVWLGINAVVIGHALGSDTFVKPGAVVSRSMPANSLVEGAPAQRVGTRFDDGAEKAVPPPDRTAVAAPVEPAARL